MRICKVIFLSLFIILFSFQSVLACECFEAPPPCYALSQSDAVFVGNIKNVISSEENPFPKVEIEVERNFRGMNDKNYYTQNAQTSCSWEFEKGEKFLFYGKLDEKDKNYFYTSFCDRTQKFAETLSDFDFLNDLNSSKIRYLIWGTISKHTDENIKGIQAQVFDNKKKLVGISDKNGDLKISVSKEGVYKLRVFPPKGTMLDVLKFSNSSFKEKLNTLKNYEFQRRKPFVDYEIEVKANKCGWFYLPLEKFKK